MHEQNKNKIMCYCAFIIKSYSWFYKKLSKLLKILRDADNDLAVGPASLWLKKDWDTAIKTNKRQEGRKETSDFDNDYLLNEWKFIFYDILTRYKCPYWRGGIIENPAVWDWKT